MEAVTLIGLLADEERLRVVGAVALGHDRAGAVAEAADLPLKQVVKHLARLEGSGLLVETEGRYRVDVGELRLLAREGSQRPLEEFDAPPQEAVVLRRFIRDGKLISIPLVRSKRLVILDHLA
jgi:DNA-binding transcriptional ArsR family regulator